VLAVCLALVAAFLYALGTVLQQKADIEEADTAGVSAGFVRRLVQRPVWLAGVVSELVGFGVLAVALGIGRLVIVQPLQVLSVVIALPLGAWLTGQRVGRRQVYGAVLVTAGLVAFLALSDPSGGNDDAPVRDWLIAGAVIGGASAVLVVAGLRARPALRAALIGTAAGILFGLQAALTKATVTRVPDGIDDVVFDWHLYALVVVGLAAFGLTQLSLQGGLAPSLASTATFDPVSSLVLGLTLLDEQLHDSAAVSALSIAALIVSLGGLLVLLLGREAPAAAPAPAPAA
jgi:drug/metabolite transporter (DMT)-like permease